MDIKIEQSWKEILEEEISKPYFLDLVNFVKSEYRSNKVYPPGNQIFSAFNLTPFNKVRVVILGQDPYHGKGQANGLSFSVSDGVKHPPSLQNIFKELESDLNMPIPVSGNLERWAKQGVLLLNSILTVREAEPGSHQNKGWELFSDAVIKKLSSTKNNLVFILWGKYAQQKGKFIDELEHCVIKSPHPSPFSVYRGFYGSRPFSKTNDYLLKKHGIKIDW